MRKENIPLNETAYTALVKVVTRAKDLSLAESIITEAEGIQQCRLKLRLYSPLISTYCEMGDLLSALRIWERLTRQGISLTEKEYACYIRCCAEVGESSVMQKVFSDLSEDVLVPSKETCQAILQWFQSPFSQSCRKPNGNVSTGSVAQSSLLDKVCLPTQKGSSLIGTVECCNGWDISPVCRVETSTGVLLEGCLKGATLQPAVVPTCTWQEMMQMNEEIVLSGSLDNHQSPFQGARKGRKRKLVANDCEERALMWRAFKEYLQGRGSLDVIIDGGKSLYRF